MAIRNVGLGMDTRYLQYDDVLLISNPAFTTALNYCLILNVGTTIESEVFSELSFLSVSVFLYFLFVHSEIDVIEK